MTGAVTSQRVTEVRDGERHRVGHPVGGARARARLTVRPTGRTGTKVGPSDPGVFRVEGPSPNGSKVRRG